MISEFNSEWCTRMLEGLFISQSLSVFSGPPQRKSHIAWCMGSRPLRDRNPSLWDETTQGLQDAESLLDEDDKEPSVETAHSRNILSDLCGNKLHYNCEEAASGSGLHWSWEYCSSTTFLVKFSCFSHTNRISIYHFTSKVLSLSWQ